MENENRIDEKKITMKVETKEEIIEHLLKSEDDIEHGRVIPIEDIIKERKEKYGI